MKVVILAGGYGTRISEESHLKPKPMIEIGGMPILWHVMKLYSAHGFNEFVICCGYKQHMIKEYFADYYLHRSDVSFDFRNDNRMTIHSNVAEPWLVTLVDTGLNTMTGGRVKRIRKYVDDQPFFLTYGDGVSNVNIKKQLAFHRQHGKIGTLTAVSVAQRFGVLDVCSDGRIENFREKNDVDAGQINGGFMIMNPGIFDLIEDDDTVFERQPLEGLASRGELMAYHHDGFWQCMDTQRDKQRLEELWERGSAPWKVW